MPPGRRDPLRRGEGDPETVARVDDTGGASTWAVGSAGDLLDGLQGRVLLDAGPAADPASLVIRDSGDTTANTGTLRAGELLGFGMPAGGGVGYVGFDSLRLELGSGDNSLFVDGTHAGTTFITSGAGDDVVNIDDIGGKTEITLDGGNDIIRVNYGGVRAPCPGVRPGLLSPTGILRRSAVNQSIKVAIYARVSSDQQADKDISIPSQLRLLKEHAAREGWEIVREYVDEGESAKSTDRPSFQEMIAATHQKPLPFAKIIVWKLSRFARNRYDSVVHKAHLKRKGIEVVSISENIADSPDGHLLEGMLETIDQYYIEVLSQETLRGMVENARRGFVNGGFVPFGYRHVKIQDARGNEKSKKEPVPEEAQIVLEAFNLYRAGNGIKAIVASLNERGMCRRGQRWTSNAVQALLNNEAYIGWTVFNKRDKKTEGRRFKPKDQWIIVTDTHPAIIPEDLFREVQAKLEAAAPENTSGRTTASNWALSGLVFCGKCGRRYLTSSYGRDKGYVYVQCGRSHNDGRKSCPGRRLREDVLTPAVLDAVQNQILDEQAIERLVEDVNQMVGQLRVLRRAFPQGSCGTQFSGRRLGWPVFPSA